MVITKKILFASVLILSIIVVCLPSGTQAAAPPPVAQVHAPSRGTTTTTSLPVTLSATPTEGNVLIAVIGMRFSSSGIVTEIDQVGVAWTELQNSPNWPLTGTARYKVATWVGIVGAGADTAVTIHLTGTNNAVADIAEYSGLGSDFNVKYSVATGNTAATSTGSVATTHANELWIGGIIKASRAQTTPTNGFTLYDGAVYNSAISTAYLEKIVTANDTAATGTSTGGTGYWSGLILALSPAPTIELSEYSAPTGTIITMKGYNFQVDSDILATFGADDLTLVGDAHTDDAGQFTVTFTVPAVVLGAYEVTAVDMEGGSATADFLVVVPPVPENPVGVLAPIAAIGSALALWGLVKRSRTPTKNLPF